MLTRREVLKSAASAIVVSRASAAPASAGAQQGLPNPHGTRGIGAASPGFGARMRANAAATPPVEWIDYCHATGFGGVEGRLPPSSAADTVALRAKLESYKM